MSLEFRTGPGALPVKEYLALAQRVWPREYAAAEVAGALARTRNAGAWDGERLVGSVRVLTDGHLFSTVPEILVDPDYRRQGIGRRLMGMALELAPRGKLFLGAQAGNEPFFEACGFTPGPSGYVGHRASAESVTVELPNVKQAVPFFGVTDMDASLRFYMDGLGFKLIIKWTPDGGGRIRWCWLELDEIALMLQEYWKDGRRGGAPAGPLGQGVSVCFMCADAIAIYHAAKARGLAPARPFVGNRLWVTSFSDPDGYRLDFESPTEVPEETVYEG